MMTLRRGEDRRHETDGFEDAWFTFGGQDTLADDFVPLRRIKEASLPGQQMPQRPSTDADILTYVHEGAVSYANPVGRLGVVRAGFFLFTRAAEIVYTELPETTWVPAHLVQFFIHPSKVAPPMPPEFRHFSFAERKGRMRLVVSGNGAEGSLRIPHDLMLFSAVLSPGQHVAHQLRKGQRGWLQVVSGEVRVGNTNMVAGDGAGFTSATAVSVRAMNVAEVLLLDLGDFGGEVASRATG